MEKISVNKKIYSYNALRGIAALGILFSHMSYLSQSDSLFWKSIYDYFMRYGSRCTSFFFILSGFLIAYTWKNCSFKQYLLGKFKRLYPLTVIVFLLAVACSLLLSGKNDVGSASACDQLWILSLILNPLLLKAYVPIEKVFYSFHGPSWYISALFGLYIISYFFMKWSYKKEKKTVDRTLIGWIIVTYVVELCICLWIDFSHGEKIRLYWAYVNPYFRIFGEGMLGILLCRKMDFFQRKIRKYNYSLLQILAMVILILDLFLNNYIRTSLYSAWIQFIPMCFLLIVFYSDQGIISREFRKKAYQFLGDISFELYMTHAFVNEGLPVICHSVNKQFGQWMDWHLGIRFILTVAFSIVLSQVAHIAMKSIHYYMNKKCDCIRMNRRNWDERY